MSWMTNGMAKFLSDVRELDDIQQGCLAVRLSVGSKAKRKKLEDQCIARKWVRTEPRDDIWSRTIYLTTLGARALRREEKSLSISTPVSVEQFIKDIDALPEATTADKVHMFVQLCDHEKLINEFKKEAMMQKVGLVPPNDVYAFAYGVLKLSCPHLFVEAG